MLSCTDWITVPFRCSYCDGVCYSCASELLLLIQAFPASLSNFHRLCTAANPRTKARPCPSTTLQLNVSLCTEPLSAREDECPASTLDNHAIAKSVNRRQAEAAERGVDNGAR